MKPIFEGEVYEMLPKSDGIVFSYCRGVEDNNVTVGFKMLSFENGSLVDVAKNIYLVTKFGSNYRAAVRVCENYITSKAVVLPNDKLFIVSAGGQAYIADITGDIDWSGEIGYRNCPPNDIAFYNNALWASFANENALIRFNPNTMREELKVGGKRSPFDAPKDIFIDGATAVVCNNGSNKLIKINLDSYAVEEYKQFEERPHSYLKIGKFEFVLLDSGIYLI